MLNEVIKKMKRLSSLLFCLFLLTGVIMNLVSCNTSSLPDVPSDESARSETVPDQTVTETKEDEKIDLIKRTLSVVVSSRALNAEMNAALKMQSMLEKMTGQKIVLQNEDEPLTDGIYPVFIGLIDSEEGRSLRSSIDELSYLISVRETGAYVFGTSGRISEFAVEVFIEQVLGYVRSATYPLAELEIPVPFLRTGSYYEATTVGKIIKYRGADNGCKKRPESDIVPGISPLENMPEGAYLTGETVSIRKDGSFGAPQFVVKLFTEGLSRTPTGDEYVLYMTQLEENGCSVQSLSDIGKAFFSSHEYKGLDLSRTEMIFTVYRAILSRDPTNDEISSVRTDDASELAASLCASAEFSKLVPQIGKGPYYWYENNRESYTGLTVMTAQDLQRRLDREKNVELDEGTLVLVDRTIEIPNKGSLSTKGEPGHYIRMARLIRVGGEDADMVHVGTGAKISHIFCDGNFRYKNDRIQGSNIVMTSNGGTLSHCRCSDAGCTYTLNVLVGTEFNYVGYNLVTSYSSDHQRTWTDGIRSMGTDGIIEYNQIVDATDAALALFRYINHIEKEPNATTYIRAQNSIVRHNTIIQAGNPSYALLDFESNNINWNDAYMKGTTLNIPENPANFEGCVFYENVMWTSRVAHTHVAITMSTQPWTLIGQTDRVFGGSVCNNSTPKGCEIVCGTGICADGNTDAVIRGNALHLLLGNFCNGLKSRPYSIDGGDSSGDFQKGFEDAPSSGTTSTFISAGRPIETMDAYVLSEAWIYEDPYTIPASRFIDK